MAEPRVIGRADLPALVAEAVRRIRQRHPEYQNHLTKRMARFIGRSTSYAEKALYGQLSGIEGSLLLNMDSFFDGLLLAELRGEKMGEAEREELILMARRIEGIARKWTLEP